MLEFGNPEVYGEIRKALLDWLRRLVPIQGQPGRAPIRTVELVRQMAQHDPSWNKSEIWRCVQDLIVEGVLLIGAPIGIQNPFTDGLGLWELPSVTISQYGIEYLKFAKDHPDPNDAISILNPLRERCVANDTVEAYISEAVRTLHARAFRGVCVLTGVAAESLAEAMFTAFADHLDASAREKFLKELNVKKTSAEYRWTEFTKRFPGQHAECVGDELRRRFENVCEPLLKLFKQNRDDAAHQRASLISREGAVAVLVSFVPFGITVADVLDALKKPCIAKTPAP